MKKSVKIILILSLIANLGIIYVGSKALEYRNHINHFLDKYEKVSDEFSARSIYDRDNKAIASDSTVENRVLFFGSQVTKNYDLKKFFPDIDAINRGVAGQRVSGYLLRFKPDVLDLHPKAVIIEISSYNFREFNTIEEIKDYTELLAQLARYNQIEPILTTVISPRAEFVDKIDQRELGDYTVSDSVRTYNEWLIDYCLKHRFPLIDVNRLLADENGNLSPVMSKNMLEPNFDGYNMITEEIKFHLELITQAGLK